MAEDVLWERDLHQRGSGRTLAVGGDCVVVHERWTRLVCLERQDGRVRWDAPFGLWPRSVVVHGDRCYGIAQNVDALTCWDVRTGAVLWTVPLPRFTGYLTAVDDTVLVGGWRGYTDLTALDADTGQVRWSTFGRPATVHPLAVGQGVLVAAPDGDEVRLLDVRDGQVLRCWTLPEPLRSQDYAQIFTRAGSDRILAPCGRRTVVELRPDTGDLRTLLRHDRDLAPVRARVAGGLLWVWDTAGCAAYDPEDGAPRWRVDLRQRLAPGVVAVGDGYVLGGDQGTLLRLDRAGRVARRTSVSRRIAAVRGAGPTEDPDILEGSGEPVGVAQPQHPVAPTGRRVGGPGDQSRVTGPELGRGLRGAADEGVQVRVGQDGGHLLGVLDPQG
ncbi:outer membrane protein assembly factor BamB [Streptacidiphilus jiangxiensis]|uniref:Outer membrane protein assembly factor BamB n=1 Tax=Streptacidiphilus jiangxiensis TaxID=235985 RepID=A0A1H7KRJ3_STRJI|nr:outer membrane protein assembly factor BamB [Streptacidiphilus jiangxiensis]